MAVSSETIQLRSIRLSEQQHELPSCRDILQPSETDRADRFIKPADRDRFILCRGLLRRILGAELGNDPASIDFHRNEQGKPYLPNSALQFNISHSNDRLLVAVTAGRAVGVDIEFRRDNVQMKAISERFFSPEELAFFLNQGTARDVFFDIWSKKEAYVKALGTGIFRDLQSFTVPLDDLPERPSLEDAPWIFQSLDIDPDYSAALVWQQLDTDAAPPNLQFTKPS